MNSVDENENKRRKDLSKKFGHNLLKLRKEKGYTREELAEKSNLSANYIYGLENGSYLPGFITIIDLSNALDITTSQLLDKYVDNKHNVFLEQVSQNINQLSDRDLDLILNIIKFCCDENNNK